MNAWVKICMIAVCTMGLHADWTLATIVNRSDLKLEQAWHYSKLGSIKVLSSLTKMLKKADQQKRESVFVKYHIASQGIALRCADGLGHQVDIFLDGQPTHSVEWDRKKTRIITRFPQKCSIADGPYCARVLVQDVADGKYVADPQAQAHDVPAKFNLIISGTNGAYQAILQEA